MQRAEKEASLRVLLAVARADGVVDAEERRTLAIVALEIGVPDGSGPTIDLEAELAKLRSPEAQALVLRAAHAVANVDGRCSPEEYAVLSQIHAAFGGEGAPDIQVAEREWAPRMAVARQGIDRATADFLRAVAALGEASDLAYTRLVQELDEKKRGALRQAITTA